MRHMIYRLEAALKLGWITTESSRVEVAASVCGKPPEVDFCMEWLKSAAAEDPCDSCGADGGELCRPDCDRVPREARHA